MADIKNETTQEHDSNALSETLNFQPEHVRNKTEVTNENLQEKNKVCKRLDFGKEEKLTEANINNLLRDDLGEQRQRAIEKWNFDFENEVPLEGQWVWEKVPVQTKSNTEIMSTKNQEDDDNRAV